MFQIILKYNNVLLSCLDIPVKLFESAASSQVLHLPNSTWRRGEKRLMSTSFKFFRSADYVNLYFHLIIVQGSSCQYWGFFPGNHLNPNGNNRSFSSYYESFVHVVLCCETHGSLRFYPKCPRKPVPKVTFGSTNPSRRKRRDTNRRALVEMRPGEDAPRR